MKQVYRKLVNYSADLFGVCSALYELGGLLVMHDASGCNSTYATHDEPRWYDIDSMIYISGLTEYDAVLGNDESYIEDVIEIAEERHPKFIAVFGSPVAALMGTDFRGIARIIEKRTQIPTFHFHTNGMHSYEVGAGEALAAIADRFCPEDLPVSPMIRGRQIRVNLIGVTPLDFSVVGNMELLEELLEEKGFEIVSNWAMGSSLQRLEAAGRADVNLVVSAVGYKTARLLRERYGTPYVVGLPIGRKSQDAYVRMIEDAARDRRSRCLDELPLAGLSSSVAIEEKGEKVGIIGEPVFASSLRFCLENDFGFRQVVIANPLEENCGLLRGADCYGVSTENHGAAVHSESEGAFCSDLHSREEEDLAGFAAELDYLVADPIYERILTEGGKTRLLPLPHEAYSGRMYRKEIPRFIGEEMVGWLNEKFRTIF